MHGGTFRLEWGVATANPEDQTGWNRFNATFNVQVGTNDEHQASFVAPAVRSYRYVYRVSSDQGLRWTYRGINQGAISRTKGYSR